MTDKKLPDSEIVKDFTEKTELIGSMSSVYLDEDKGLKLYMAMRNILDLINRLQAKLDEAEDTIQFADKELKKAEAENERLNFLLNDAYENNRGLVELLERAKTEAYKECIEMVKKKGINIGVGEIFITTNTLNNLLKELVGDSK